MRFSSKRGRPKKVRDTNDLGTKEFQQKKRSGFTDSLLSLLKQRNVLEEREYEVALWFRYLYSVKYGNPNIISACNFAKVRGLNSFMVDIKKQKKIEKIYNKVCGELQKAGVKNLMLDVCVYENKNALFNLDLRRLERGIEIISVAKL